MNTNVPNPLPSDEDAAASESTPLAESQPADGGSSETGNTAPPESSPAADAATSETGASETGASEAGTPETTSDSPPAMEAPPTDKARIEIGSRRGKGANEPRSSRPKVAGNKIPDLPSTPSGPVPTPSVREPLSPELEEELNAALGNASLDDILSGESAGGQPLEEESRHRATVMRIHQDDIFLSIDGRNEGMVSLRQFTEPPELGSTVDVVILGFNADEGLYEVSVPGASIAVNDWADVAEGALVEARVTGSNTGGLECVVNTIRAFIPASQVALYRIEDFSDFVDQKLLCVVTEANPQRKNLVLSRRAVLEREKEEARKQLMTELEVGQTRDAVIRSLREFGAFADLGGVDGLIHISQMSWDRVAHPSEVVSEGQKVRVKIEKIDQATGKIGLSLRSLTEDPWATVEQDYPMGSVLTGTVTRIAKFGAFVKLGPGVEGLIHISELSHARVSQVGHVVSEGQQVEVKVLSVDPEAQRIGLSLKATTQAPQKDDPASETAEDEPPRPLAVPKHDGPLKGGRDRPSGGDQFGLNW